MKLRYLFILAVAAFWFLSGMNPVELAQSMAAGIDDLANRGPKVHHGGSPIASPEEIADQTTQWFQDYTGDTTTTISIRAATMARVIRSERSIGGPQLEAVIIGWILKNDAERNFGGDVLAAATAPRYSYGPQAGVRYSTARDAYRLDLMTALSILTDEIPDPTGGATNFLHPKGFKTPADYARVREKWIAAGKTPIRFLGAPTIEVYA